MIPHYYQYPKASPVEEKPFEPERVEEAPAETNPEPADSPALQVAKEHIESTDIRELADEQASIDSENQQTSDEVKE